MAGKRGGGKRTWAWGLTVVLALLIALVPWRRLSASREDPALWLADAPTRPLEARLSVPAADTYRPYVPPHRKAIDATPVPLRALARLEAQGDSLAIAAAYLLHGDMEQAIAHLQHAPPSPERDNDRAAAALLRGQHDEALALLDAVLEVDPAHPQALWNRGLVLRELNLPLVAAEAFDKVAARGEPGWSEEARAQADSLRVHLRQRAEAWRLTRDALTALISTPGAPPPVEGARRFPGLARGLFYEAVRAAPNAEQVLALLPLAGELDHAAGGTALADAVRRVATRDFTRRAPLAHEYARLVLDQHPTPAELVTRLRAAGEPDLLLGALLHLPTLARTAAELRALARDVDDPWLLLRLEEEYARLEALDNQGFRAGQRLDEALRTCRGLKLPDRCLVLLARISQRATAANRLAEAEESARALWTEATALGEWELEGTALNLLGDAARFQVRMAASRAYLSESLARRPDNCQVRNYVHRTLSSLALMSLRPREARRELEEALACGQSPGLLGAWILADLARLDPRPSDEPRLRKELARVSPTHETPGRRVLATLIEGRFEVERDWRAGQAVLRKAISEAEPLLQADADARDARTIAYQTMAVSAGKAGAFSEAMAVVAEGLHVPVPTGCVLAAAVESERTVTVARGRSGQVRGHFDASRREPLRDDLSGLVPPDLVAMLRECPRVAVLAAPPLDSRAGILPPDLAWSYDVGAGEHAEAPEKPLLQLVVANVETLPSLRLARLPSWDSEPEPRTLELTGQHATPERVLAAMEEATDIEIHAHGVVDRAISDATVIALAPEQDGRYALTAEDLRRVRLGGAPLVLLGACSAARLPPFLHQTSSLPQAFITSGARAVFAATMDIPDSAGRFFRAVRARIQAGAEPSQALRDERLGWHRKEPGARWVDTVLLYQ